VSLRYSLDVSDFVDARETYYYSTVGKDGWLEEFAEFVKKLTLSLNDEPSGSFQNNQW
jgi:hypothetical protein